MFDLVGIKLSPMYLQFSMVANRPSNKLTVKQKALVNLYENADHTALYEQVNPKRDDKE